MSQPRNAVLNPPSDYTTCLCTCLLRAKVLTAGRQPCPPFEWYSALVDSSANFQANLALLQVATAYQQNHRRLPPSMSCPNVSAGSSWRRRWAGFPPERPVYLLGESFGGILAVAGGCGAAGSSQPRGAGQPSDII